MAVYTHITLSELASALAAFPLGNTEALQEVGDGIENTTYFFRATSVDGAVSEYVLTIIENLPLVQVRYSAELCIHLENANLPVPAPVRNYNGDYLFSLAGKDALIFPRAKGRHPRHITAEHCRVIGDYLAHAHRQGMTFPGKLANSRGLGWLQRAADALALRATRTDSTLLQEQLVRYKHLVSAAPSLSQGAIHGDLFRDNTLFCGHRLSGVIDFYNACNDWLLMDVAIALNDWCVVPGSAGCDDGLSGEFLAAYHRVRPFTAEERQCWQEVLCIAATRFWVSRLLGHLAPELLGGEVKTKDPQPFKALLLHHRHGVPPLPGE